jgi:hypothetical protein
MKIALATLFAATALAACMTESDRREFIYKPAYCLAGGLASLNSEECMPETLKEKAVAVADAKLKDAAAETPSEEFKVYYTNDQRMVISYDIARVLFTPSKKVTKQSAIMSLEAAGIIEPSSAVSKECGADKAREDVIAQVNDRMSDNLINRDTAAFLAENYTDLQLNELYRVAKENGTLSDVKDDAFILPDPKNAKKSINVKPKNDHNLGGILSFTTSRVASRMVSDNRKAIEESRDKAIERRKLEACPPAPVEEEVVAEPVAEEGQE